MSKVRIERAGNRILLASEAPTPGLKTSIPGAYWRSATEVWSLPLDLTTCHLLRERFGQRLVIGPNLTSWARAEKAQRNALSSTALAMDADLRVLPEVAPKLYAAMASRTYQRSAARYVADAIGRDGRRRALIADTVGLGKTAESLAGVLESGVPGPYLIVTPKTAVENVWAPEIRRWLPDDEIVTVPEGRAKRDAILDALSGRKVASLQRTWVIVHPALVRTQTWFICALCGHQTKYTVRPVDELDCCHPKDRSTKILHDHEYPQLFAQSWGAVVADESDQMLIRLTGTPNLQRRGMEMLRDLVASGGCRIAMSGTPFRSKPHQIWSTLNWLDPVRWGGKWRWVQQYWETGGYSGYEVKQEGFREEREQLLLDELKDVMIRRRREDVRGDLPAKLYPSNIDEAVDGLTSGIYLPMTPAQEKAYRAMEKIGEAEIEGGTLTAIGTLAELTRLKQFAGAVGRLEADRTFTPSASGNKYEWLIEFLRQLGFPDRPATKLVIASQFTQVLNAFSEGVRKEFRGKIVQAKITGEQSQTQRTTTVEQFEDLEHPLSLIFINTKAGGSAITLDAADIMVVLDETWVDDEQQQLEGRIDNRQPERKIVPRSYYYLRSKGTVEEGIARANAEARRRGERILDGAAIAKRVKEIRR